MEYPIIILGCESFWSKIENAEELKDITDEEINNNPYMKILKELGK